ncbi:hypothetical protein [Kaistia algarum]|uniref:hypothetical protein n=1 Tax=Kaistia algarum TaxID=2083279 RepID=UPI0022513655|nr:hypothetical protein [Kaistia algarum]MCX5516556.1 hypothetical protein [Kaistia algarum]
MVLIVGHAVAGDCRLLAPTREREVLASFLKKTGYTSRQVSVVLKFADGRAQAWRSIPLNKQGRFCGAKAIGASIYWCVPSSLTRLLQSSLIGIHEQVTEPSVLKFYGVKQLTQGETIAGAAVSMCQLTAIDIFAQH